MSYRYPSGDAPATILGRTGWWRRWLKNETPAQLPPAWNGRRTALGDETFDFFASLADDPLATPVGGLKQRIGVQAARNLDAGFILFVNDEMIDAASGAANFWSALQADAGDLRVSADAAGSTRLPVAVLHINKGAGEISVAIRLPDGLDEDDYVYLWSGNPGVELEQPGEDEAFGVNEVFQDELFANADFQRTADLTGLRTLSPTGETLAPVAGPGSLPATEFNMDNSEDNVALVQSSGIALPAVHTLRTWRFTPTGAGNANKRFIGRQFGALDGQFRRATGATRLELSQNFTTTDGVWNAAHSFTTDAWRRYAFRADLSSVSNTPAIFDNKNSLSVVAGVTPVGDHDPGSGPFLFIDAFNSEKGYASLTMLREGALSDAWLDAEYDMIADPLTVAAGVSVSEESEPGFDSVEAFAPVALPLEASLSGLPLSSVMQADLDAHHDFMPHVMGGMWMGGTPDTIAEESGDWSDSGIWSDGVPGAGDIAYIPAGVKVWIDGDVGSAGNHLAQIAVAGILEVEPDVEATVFVHDLTSDNRGVFLCGRADAPFAGDIAFDFGAVQLNPATDPRLMKHGVNWMGHWRVYGAPKTAYAYTVAGGVADDETVIELDEAPEGWAVGDRIVIEATHYHNPGGGGVDDKGNQTEYREIVSMDLEANPPTITIDEALVYDHTIDGASAEPGAEAPPEMRCCVGNLTRNVRFEGPDDAEPYERPHVMMMATDKVTIHYTAFNSLGRTDKRVEAFDIPDLPDPIAYDSNIKGRYALHLHGCGVWRSPIHLKGLAFYDIVGIGLDNHSSHELAEDIVSAKSHGAHYMAEAGDEKGTVRRWRAFDQRNDYNDITQKNQPEELRHDWGRSAFFHFQSRELIVEDIVGSGSYYGDVAVWQTRGASAHRAFAGNWNEGEAWEEGAPAPREIARYRYWGSSTPPNLIDTYGDRAPILIHPLKATKVGGRAVRRVAAIIKEGNKAEHNFPTLLKEFWGDEVRMGVHTEYTAHYMHLGHWFRRAADAPGGGGNFGTEIGQEGMAQYIVDLYAEGFDYAVRVMGGIAGGYPTTLDRWDMWVVRLRAVDCDTEVFDEGRDYGGTPIGVHVVEEEDLLEETPALALDRNEYSEASQNFRILGARTDELEVASAYPPAKEDGHFHNRMRLVGALREYGYWQETGTGDFFTEVHEWSFSRLTGEPFLTIARVYLPLEPTSAAGSNLAVGPAHEFNGAKA